MALSTNYNTSLSFALIAIFFFSLTSGGINNKASRMKEERESKMVLGSRPPACVNKCFNCRPCNPTLFIPPHFNKSLINKKGSFVKLSSLGEDDTYYLLSWKCRCGNKLYQP